MNQATLEVYHTLQEYGVALGYSGFFTDDITDNFILFCDDLIVNQKNDLKTSKVINFLLCESFQNVVRHANNEDINDDSSFEGYFGFHNLGHDYRLNSINKVNTSDKQKVISGIESVNNKTREELRAMYRLKLDEGEFSEKGGAGLGYIQMARKSGKNILYKLDESNVGVDRLHQQIMISQVETAVHTSRIEMSEKQFNHMTDNGQILQYKGDFSIIRLDSISRILSVNFSCLGDPMIAQEIIFNTLSGLFQNAQVHGCKVDGLDQGSLVVSRLEGSLVIEMGNPILKANVDDISEKLEKDIVAKTKPGILYQLEQMISHKSEIQFQIDNLDDEFSFLTVSLKICSKNKRINKI